MAASEDEAQPVVLNTFMVPRRRVSAIGGESCLNIVWQRFKSSTPADCVDRLEAAGRYKPSPRIGGHTIARPLLQSCIERIVQRLLGDIEVAEEAGSRGEARASLRTVDAVHRVA